jgi:hypothetical protein
MYRALVFTNTGRRTRTIQGFPRVSFVADGDGHQVGAVAAPVGEEGPPVVLEPGAAAATPLGFTNIGTLDPAQCRLTAVRGLRVYPPHGKASVFVPFATTACADAMCGSCLSVMTVHAGSGLG